jgi:hypothetical protein
MKNPQIHARGVVLNFFFFFFFFFFDLLNFRFSLVSCFPSLRALSVRVEARRAHALLEGMPLEIRAAAGTTGTRSVSASAAGCGRRRHAESARRGASAAAAGP